MILDSMTSVVEEAEMLTVEQLNKDSFKSSLHKTEFAELITRMQRADSDRFYQF